MTKKTKKSKLALDLHTVRTLSQLELVVVNGGVTRPSSPDPDDGCEYRRL